MSSNRMGKGQQSNSHAILLLSGRTLYVRPVVMLIRMFMPLMTFFKSNIDFL